jgi:hypothetical protein
MRASVERLFIGCVLVLSFLCLAGKPVFAAPIGGLVITPGQGQDAASIRMRTSGGCPADADAYYATMRGKGMPAEGQIVVANTDAGLSHAAGFEVFLAQTLRDFAADNKTTLSGKYDIALYCIDSFSQENKGEFTAALTFDSPVNYAALGAAKGPDRVPESPAPAPPQTSVAPPAPSTGAGAEPVPGTVPPPSAVAAPSEGSTGTAAVFGLVAGVGLVAALVALGAWVVRRRVQQ